MSGFLLIKQRCDPATRPNPTTIDGPSIDGSTAVDCPAFGRPVFSPCRHPFLHPLHLLDSAVDETLDGGDGHGGSGAGSPLEWWLIHSKPRQEKRLAAQLKALDVPHYLPVTDCRSVTRGRPRITKAPLFAGYLFLHGSFEQRRSALATNRIVATHRIGDPIGAVKQLRDLADLIEKGVPLRIEERLAAGQYVQVKSGPLKGKCGVVMKRAGRTRLFVLVNELLGGVSLDIEQHLLEPYGVARRN